MRLIDADAFIQMMEEKCDPESTLDPWVLSVCRGGVKMMPTVDAVQVVRCKDCKWRDNQKGATEWMPCRVLITPNNFYCASGKQKDGGDGSTD